MRSRFPGMDPWLELYWRDVHASLIIYIRNQLQPQLPEPLVARAEEDVSVDAEEQAPVLLRPDVAVAQDRPRDSNGGVATLSPPAAVAKPLLVYAAESEIDRHVEIIDPTSGGRVITAIEVLSPSNKLPGRSRLVYESKQRLFLAGGINLVEIDLVRKGPWAFSISESALGRNERSPYMACVFRASQPVQRALYRFPLREPLPSIAIPLRPRDRDVVLNLQQVVDEAYETGRYDRTDYRQPLDPPLNPEDSAWASDVLSQNARES